MKLKELFIDEEEKIEIPKWVYTFIFFTVWTVILNVLAILYIKNSNFIYFWDNATYWDISRKKLINPSYFLRNGKNITDLYKLIIHVLSLSVHSSLRQYFLLRKTS